MDNDEDFTFAQVLPPVGSVEVHKVADCISDMHVDSGDKNDDNVGVVWKEGTKAQQASVGSLMFTVINASSQKADQRSNRTTTENPVKKKPAGRAKVPFEKGYSQMDWLKLARTHPDLAGLNGQSNQRLICLNEVKQHQSGSSMWTILKGRVYNIAPYMKFHPGGADMLMKAVGKDCTSLFNKYHAWVNADFLLEKCLVGILDDGPSKI